LRRAATAAVVPMGEGVPCHARSDDYPGKAHDVSGPAQLSMQAVCYSAVVESRCRCRLVCAVVVCLMPSLRRRSSGGRLHRLQRPVRCRRQGTTGIRGAPSEDTIRQPLGRFQRTLDLTTKPAGDRDGSEKDLVLGCVLSHKIYLTRLPCSVWATLAISRWPQREAALASTGRHGTN
jgi:hypothetical protein